MTSNTDVKVTELLLMPRLIVCTTYAWSVCDS